ncbi:MAG: hypothetical protein KAI22_04785 [Gammaproteobacteria bacterium]|nr:hypothetical protein [Gammaproteobacteria bacterium]
MRQYLHLFLSSALSFLIFLIPVHAADFNIKLRKTDINELKQQLMPAFEQNILYLHELLSCLERKKMLDVCLNEYTLVVDGKESANSSLTKERNEQLKQTLENKINEKNIQPEEVISELKKLLAEAEQIKRCLYQGQTANELKDCIVKP